MKVIKFIVILYALMGYTLSASEVHWFSNVDNAIIQAKKEKTPILVFVYSDTCHYCRDSIIILKSDEVSNLLAQQNMITVVAINQRDRKTLFKYHLVAKAFPSYFILSEDGTQIAEPINGFIDANYLRSMIISLTGWYKKSYQ